MRHSFIDSVEYWLAFISYFINLEQSKVAVGGVLFAFFRQVLQKERNHKTAKERWSELAFIFWVLYSLYPWLVVYFSPEWMPMIASALGWAGYQSVALLLDQLWLYVTNKIQPTNPSHLSNDCSKHQDQPSFTLKDNNDNEDKNNGNDL